MGQRSQIYVRIENERGEKFLIAKYFQWNYGQYMLSRARYGIEYCINNMEYLSLDNTTLEELSRFLEVNIDIKSLVLGANIIKEYNDWGERLRNKKEFKEYVFEQQDNNDGKLFIDVNQKNKTIKYCLTDYDLKIFKSGKEYLDWDCEDWCNFESKYYDEEIEKRCRKNITEINKMAEVMTEEELKDFINDDYSKYYIKKEV